MSARGIRKLTSPILTTDDPVQPKVSDTLLDQLKFLFRDQLGLPSWAVLIAAGCLAHIAVNLILRKPITSGWGVLGALGLGLTLESYEIWIQYRTVGLFAPGNDPVLTIIFRHFRDVSLMLAGPLLIVVGAAVAN